jgi:hypothetical protein
MRRDIDVVDCSPLGRIEKGVQGPNLAGLGHNHVEAGDGRLFPCEAETPCQLSYSVIGAGHAQICENEIRKFQQEPLDVIVDGFESDVQTIRIDEYAIRLPYRRHGRAPHLRAALAECFQVLSQEIVYTLHRVLCSAYGRLYLRQAAIDEQLDTGYVAAVV